MKRKIVATIKIPSGVVGCLADDWIQVEDFTHHISMASKDGVTVACIEKDIQEETSADERMEVHVSVFEQLNRDVYSLALVLAERECGSHRHTLQDIINRRAKKQF